MQSKSTMPALILFAHGSRDPRWVEPFLRLQEKLQTRHSAPVRLAYLELLEPSLLEAAQQAVQQGCQSLCVVPIFLGQGGHVRKDLPDLIAQLQHRYPMVSITCADAAGEDDAVLEALAQYCLRQL